MSDMFAVDPWGDREYGLTASEACRFLKRNGAADVAELADALDSKSSTRESVWVRPPPSAPTVNFRAPSGDRYDIMAGLATLS
jgi:hypothetical protein